MFSKRRFSFFLAATLLATFGGCGGGGTSSSNGDPALTKPVLISLSIDPVTPTVAAGAQQQFKVMGVYTNKKTADLTSSVAWSSSDAGIASISSIGLATGESAGAATITASYQGVSQTTTMTVTASSLMSITINPSAANITTGQTQQFTATGSYSDGTTHDITSTATWISSSSSVAAISNSGLASGTAAGSTVITASTGGKSGSAALSVAASAVPASSGLSYYCDPDFAGAVRNGSASNPWTKLDATAWSTINGSLASNDVTVYFSARNAGFDTDKSVAADYFLQIKRTDTSTHRLTLDGMSMYDTNTASPSWAAYSGNSRFRITGMNPIAVPNDPPVIQSYLTVRGFRTISTAYQGFYFFGGNHVIVENNDMSHAPGATVGPEFTTAYIRSTNDSEVPCVPSGPPVPHNCGQIQDLTIRNNYIHDTYGEGIYIGGCDGTTLNCTSYPEHFDSVLITGNTVKNPACSNGGQGDGIDVKGPVTNLVISNNTIGFDNPGACDVAMATGNGGEDCIITLSPAIISGNFLYSCIRNGITLDETWDYNTDRTGEIRDNVIVNAGNSAQYSMRSGIMISVNPAVTHHWHGVLVYSNSIYRSGTSGIEIDSPAGSGHQVTDNIVMDGGRVSGVQFQSLNDAVSTHANNDFYSSTGGNVVTYNRTSYTAGSIANFDPASISSDPLFLNTAAPYAPLNFRVNSGSPTIGTALTLSSWSYDFEGVDRNPDPWDMGAFKFHVP